MENKAKKEYTLPDILIENVYKQDVLSNSPGSAFDIDEFDPVEVGGQGV